VVQVGEGRRCEDVFGSGEAGEGEVLREEGHASAIDQVMHGEDSVVRV
jgi:hypothetical protein